MKKLDMIKHLRKTIPAKMAQEIVAVQPMPPIDFNAEDCPDEKWLIENGFEPICDSTRLMWVKKKNG